MKVEQIVPRHGADRQKDVTREKFIPAVSGYTNGTPGNYRYYGIVNLADGADQQIYTVFKVPDDFVSYTSLKLIWMSVAAAGTMRWGFDVRYGASGEANDTYTESGQNGETATGGANIINVQEPFDPVALTGLAKGNYVGLMMEREGTHVDDTLGEIAMILGFLFTYVAEQ